MILDFIIYLLVGSMACVGLLLLGFVRDWSDEYISNISTVSIILVVGALAFTLAGMAGGLL